MKVKSSMMKEIEYHPQRSSLLVMFNDGKIWEYANVRVEIWELLQSILTVNRHIPEHAECEEVSFGRAFHYLIRLHSTRYPATHRSELTTCDMANADVDSES